MKSRKKLMSRVELLAVKEHLSLDSAEQGFFNKILSELDSKPVWYTSDFSVPQDNSLAICNSCRKIYQITLLRDSLIVKDEQGKPAPYCETCGVEQMSNRLHSQKNS